MANVVKKHSISSELAQKMVDNAVAKAREIGVSENVAILSTARTAVETKTNKDKEIRIPGPDHPITISPAVGKVRVTVAGRKVAESTRALRLEEMGYPPVYYLPRDDADMSLLLRTKHYTYCPYKGDCTYYSIPIGGSKSEYAVWTYEKPYEAVADIKEHLAFYPSRVDAIEVIS